MQDRPTLAIFLCLLVVAAHTHCVLAHGAELLEAVHTSEIAKSPIGSSQGCENESACICKGATLGEQLDATLIQSELTLWLTYVDNETSSCVIDVSDQLCSRCLEPAPPPRGAAARAALQSFQI